MDKYSIDYDHLEKAVNKPKVFKYEDVKHRLQKVAFGTVRFMDANEDIDGLWEIQQTDDGDVIVAKYDYNPMTSESSEEEGMKIESSWDVVPDRRGANVYVFYKGEPVTSIEAEKFAAAEEDLPAICKNAAAKLNTDSQFKDMLLSEVALEDKIRLFSRYPELTA